MKVFMLLFLLILTPNVDSWNWETHQAFVEAFYYSVDDETRNRLDLYQLQQGSIAPDKEFKDFVRHSYPKSVERIDYWLDIVYEGIEKDDWESVSYSFGVVSHYLVDSFSAPHNIKGEKYKDHSNYENQGSEGYVFVECNKSSYDLAGDLEQATLEGLSWDDWLDSRNKEYPMDSVSKAMRLVYVVGLDVLNSTCDPLDTEFVKLSFWKKIKRYFTWYNVTLVVVILILLYSAFRDLKNCSEDFEEPIDDDSE